MAAKVQSGDGERDERVLEDERTGDVAEAESVEAKSETPAPHPLAGLLLPVTVEDIVAVLERLDITDRVSLERRFGEARNQIFNMVTRRLITVRQHLKENEQ